MKILPVLFSVFLSFTVSAQKIHFTDTSNVWRELEIPYSAPDPPTFYYSTYSYVGDSIFSSIKYIHFSFGFVREDTIINKVFIRDVAGDSDILLMDYNLNLGDTFTTAYYKFPVVRVDSTLIDLVWHKVWYFPFYTQGWYANYDTIYVIEGLGCIEHPTFMLMNANSCIECSEPYMYCFSNKGTTPPISPQIGWLDNLTSCSTYPHLSVKETKVLNDIAAYPDPAYNELTITSTNPITSIAITNLIGQTIYTHEYNSSQVQIDVADLPAGIYLVRINGTEVRKFVKE